MPLETAWIGTGDPRLPHVREMFEEYQAELGIDLCFQGFQEELAALPGKYGPPRGALMLVYDIDTPAACGALRDLGNDIAELKRLYVRPAYRGSGLGRRVTVALMDRARELEYRLLRLDTLRRLEPAVSLYKSLGFAETAPFNDPGGNDVVYFELPLEP